MLKQRTLLGILWIYHQLMQPIGTLDIIAVKQYRIEKYSMYNCDKAPKNEYIIYNKATMKIYGGRDKIISDGWFEILQDIHEEITVKCFLTRCNEQNPTECEFKRRELALPTVCGKSGEEFKITTVLHGLLQRMVDEFLRVLVPPMQCPVIKKNKYSLNLSIDMSAAKVFPLEGSRWSIGLVFTKGGPNPIPLICSDLEMTVRRTQRRG